MPLYLKTEPAVQKLIDISCRPGPQQQTCCSGMWWLNDERDKQTPDSYIDHAIHCDYVLKPNVGNGTDLDK